MHSSVAMLKLAELGVNPTTIIFLKIMIEKRYALPIRVVNALVQFILTAEQIDQTLPVIWFQLVLSTCELYSSTIKKKLIIEKQNMNRHVLHFNLYYIV